MSEWKEYRLREIATPVRDKIETSCLSSSSYISTENMLPNKAGVTLSSGIPSGNAIKFKKGDVLISNIRPYFKKIWRADKIGGCSADVICLRALDCVDSAFLYYLLSQDLFFNYVMQGSKGTKMPRGDRNQIMQWPVKIPCFDTQRYIASFLSSLDDKIAVNKKICENLEAQAQALFKHWFVDFAPFKDGKFIESELGLIPEGWKVGTYDEIIQDTISGDWGKEKPEGNYIHKVACIRGCDFQDVKMGLRGKTPERYILEKNYVSKHFNDKDVLVEISGGTATVSTGRICPVSQLLIDKYNGDIVCTNFCRLVRPCIGYSSYLYYSWKYKYDKKVMFGYENGTSGIKNFSIKDFTSREPLIIPSLSDLKIFEDMVEHIHTHIQNLGSESAKLATIRDTLLPKLMSGQIKL